MHFDCNLGFTQDSWWLKCQPNNTVRLIIGFCQISNFFPLQTCLRIISGTDKFWKWHNLKEGSRELINIQTVLDWTLPLPYAEACKYMGTWSVVISALCTLIPHCHTTLLDSSSPILELKNSSFFLLYYQSTAISTRKPEPTAYGKTLCYWTKKRKSFSGSCPLPSPCLDIVRRYVYCFDLW